MSSFSERLLSALGGSYTIERELTGGGMALVFVGEDHDLGRKVVIKILPPELAASVSAERFRREILTVARLQTRTSFRYSKRVKSTDFRTS